MIKALVGKFGTLAMLAAVAGSAVVACSSDVSKGPSDRSASSNDGNIGSIGLKLVPVSGVTINSVNYVVTGTPAIAGTALPSGVLPTPGTDKSFNFGVQVPVGTDYTLSLTAVSAETNDDVTCTGSAGPFAVTPNNAVNISVTLTCRDNSTGQFIANVDVVTDACPRIVADYAVAIPGTSDVGKNIAVNALGHDLDGKPVTYAWSIPAANAGVGSFVAANSQATNFSCVTAGSDIPVTVTISNGECSRPLLTTLSCRNVLCGNGVLDAGESCDPGAAPGTTVGGTYGCPADCTLTCGDGNIEAPAEQCEIPGGVPTANCTAECRTRAPLCGDGFITGPDEICDGTNLPAGTPSGSSCIMTGPNACKQIDGPAPVVCGNGVVEAGEECEPSNSRTCSDTCQSVASEACVTCEQNGACDYLSDACLGFTGQDRTNCYKVQECITDTNCADGVKTLTSCYCGSLTTGDCSALPTLPPGDCAEIIRNAMGGPSTSNPQVLLKYLQEDVPGGAAIARYNCDKADPACLPLCGF